MEVSWRLRGPGLASVVRWRWSVSNLLVATRVKEQPAAAGLAANERAAARFTSRSCCQDPGRPWAALASPLNWGHCRPLVLPARGDSSVELLGELGWQSADYI